jgi:hypothetical protein
MTRAAIIARVAIGALSNDANRVFATDVGFPRVDVLAA